MQIIFIIIFFNQQINGRCEKILSELYQKVYFKELEAQIHKILATESKNTEKFYC